MSKASPKKLRKFIPVEEAIARWRQAHEDDAGRHRAPGERVFHAVDANAQALRRGDRLQAQDPLRTFKRLSIGVRVEAGGQASTARSPLPTTRATVGTQAAV